MTANLMNLHLKKPVTAAQLLGIKEKRSGRRMSEMTDTERAEAIAQVIAKKQAEHKPS